MEAIMTESEIRGLLDAHDDLIRACVHSQIPFTEFLAAYGEFPHNYALDGHEAATDEDRAILAMFRRRIAFHLRASGVVSGICLDQNYAKPLYVDAGRFLPAVGLMRLRELVGRYPDLEAPPDFRV